MAPCSSSSSSNNGNDGFSNRSNSLDCVPLRRANLLCVAISSRKAVSPAAASLCSSISKLYSPSLNLTHFKARPAPALLSILTTAPSQHTMAACARTQSKLLARSVGGVRPVLLGSGSQSQVGSFRALSSTPARRLGMAFKHTEDGYND